MSWGGLEEDSPASLRLDRLSLKSENESILGQEDTTRSVVISLLAATIQQDKQVRHIPHMFAFLIFLIQKSNIFERVFEIYREICFR